MSCSVKRKTQRSFKRLGVRGSFKRQYILHIDTLKVRCVLSFKDAEQHREGFGDGRGKGWEGGCTFSISEIGAYLLE